ncbi:response regulator [Anabaena sp. CA = ATCC 33047]|uniref:response regulator n=1 Tax=Anabaena sp. (strain CA / ATCC 33047) TaxID=52271 RepID=UPI000A067954|nr:response regulator [Anabaena sp. CA = ATCC 33047]
MSLPEYFYESGPILLVDDTPDNLRLLSKILESRGFKVRKTISGKMAIQAAQLEPPDLILLDINMPEMNGYEVCRQLKSHPKTADIPIIFISALDQTADKIKAFDMGGVDYITKPFQESEVLARVNNQLIIHHQEKQLKAQNQKLQKEIIKRQKIEAELQKIQRGYEEDILELTNQLQRSLALVDAMQVITTTIYEQSPVDIWLLVVQELAVSLQFEACYFTTYDSDFKNCTIKHQYAIAHHNSLACNVSQRLAKLAEFYQKSLPEPSFQFCWWEPESNLDFTCKHTILLYPVFDTQGIIGHLWLCKNHLEVFSDLETRLVTQILSLCAMSILPTQAYQGF